MLSNSIALMVCDFAGFNIYKYVSIVPYACRWKVLPYLLFLIIVNW